MFTRRTKAGFSSDRPSAICDEYMALIVLTTDYGTSDGYVAAMKGVILGIAPQATIVDVTHDIAAQDVQHGAFVLWQVLPHFPAGTIHVAVVDPGVGTARRILAVRCYQQVILAPDNGLLSFVLEDWAADEVRALTNERHMLPQRSATFHGRDIFAPVAAHVANGTAVKDLGAEAGAWERLPIRLRSETAEGELLGQVVHVDHFGNLVTNIRRTQLMEGCLGKGQVLIEAGGNTIRQISRTFADAAVGELVAYFGSSGLLEVAVNGGSAARVLSRPRTVTLTVRRA